MVFELDGMTQHNDQKIANISLYGGNGCAPCLNLKGGKKRPITAMVGAQPRTVSVFYVLVQSLFRTDFFEHQLDLLRRADEEGPITINRQGLVGFGSLENCINTWVPMYSNPPTTNRTNWFRLKVLRFIVKCC